MFKELAAFLFSAFSPIKQDRLQIFDDTVVRGIAIKRLGSELALCVLKRRGQKRVFCSPTEASTESELLNTSLLRLSTRKLRIVDASVYVFKDDIFNVVNLCRGGLDIEECNVEFFNVEAYSSPNAADKRRFAKLEYCLRWHLPLVLAHIVCDYAEVGFAMSVSRQNSGVYFWCWLEELEAFLIWHEKMHSEWFLWSIRDSFCCFKDAIFDVDRWSVTWPTSMRSRSTCSTSTCAVCGETACRVLAVRGPRFCGNDDAIHRVPLCRECIEAPESLAWIGTTIVPYPDFMLYK
jgi:hypothetical protein